MVFAPLSLLALLVLLALFPVAPAARGADSVVLDDQFTDRDRLTQALPANSRWFYLGAQAAGQRLLVPTPAVSTESLPPTELQLVSNGNYAQIFGYFTASGAPRALAVGDSLRLRLRLRLGQLHNQNHGLRIGLFNSQASRPSADSATDVFTTDLYAGYRGYFASFNPGAANGALDLRRRFDSVGASPLFTGGGTTSLAGSTANLRLAGDTFFDLELTLTRATASTLVAALDVNGVTVSATDTSPVATAFDTIGLLHNNGLPAGQTIRIDTATITYTPSGGAAQTLLDEGFRDGERSTLGAPASAAWFYRGAADSAELPQMLTIIQGGAFAPPAANTDLHLQSAGATSTALTYFTAAGSPLTLAEGESLNVRASLRFQSPLAARAPVRLGLLHSAASRATGDHQTGLNPAPASLFAAYRGYALHLDPAGAGRLAAETRTGSDPAPLGPAAFADLASTNGVSPLYPGNVWTQVSLLVTRLPGDRLRLEVMSAEATLVTEDAAPATFAFDTFALSTTGPAPLGVLLRIDDVLIVRSTLDPNVTNPSTLLSENFNASSAWPARAATTSGPVAATAAHGAWGIYDRMGSLLPGSALRLAADSTGAAEPWSATLSSGTLARAGTYQTGFLSSIPAAERTRFLTLSFHLQVSLPRGVAVTLTSISANASRGSLRRMVYPAAAAFHQRYAFELDAMDPVPGPAFDPLAPAFEVAFTLAGAPGDPVGWPAGAHSLDVDNVHLARPRYFVSPTGNDAHNGEHPAFVSGASGPLRTPSRAAALARAGDIVLIRSRGVADGQPDYLVSTDHNSLGVVLPRAGAPSGWIAVKNYPGERPLLRSYGWNVFRVGETFRSYDRNAAYVEVRDLDLLGVASLLPPEQRGTRLGSSSGNGISVEGRPHAIRPYHVRVANLRVRDAGGCGLGAQQADYLQVEGLDVEGACTTSAFAQSAISLYQMWNYAGPRDNRRMLVAGNRVIDNYCDYIWLDRGLFSDGNGIIIDNNLNTQNAVTLGAYAGRTLVTNNVSHLNGGSGIHAYYSRRVDFVNNTTYANSRKLDYGELFANQCDDVRFLNNVLVATPGTRLNPISNSANIVPRVVGVFLDHNLHRGGTFNVASGGSGNLAATRTIFVAADAARDFRLHAASQAHNLGQRSLITPAADIRGIPRGADGGIEAGAHERQPFLLARPPLALALDPGESATLRAPALGDNLRWQWFRNDVAIPGATSAKLPLSASAPGVAGSYRVTVSVVGFGGDETVHDSITTADTVVTVLTPLQAWRRENFGTTASAGPAADLADPDGDGLPNLLEYALAQDPLVPATEPNVRITNIAPALQLSFLRARAELTYIVEASSTLAPGSWTVIATNPGAVSLTVPVTVTDPVAVSTESRRFLRLRVQ
jgi:hypothetical protein